MKSDDLKSKWATIEDLPREGDFDLIALSSERRSELFLAISPDSCRSLILALPPENSFDFLAIERDKLSLKKLEDRNYLAMTLHDPEFFDLFDDLVVSLHNALRGIEDIEGYFRVYLQTFSKWSQFFEKSNSDRLPDDVILGIFGELVFLRKLLTDSPASDVNILLTAWRGPYDDGQDFKFEDRHIEVKTTTLGNLSVKITNENQLDQIEGKRLELVVVTLERGGMGGQTLMELTLEVAGLVENALGDAAILYKALRQKNLGRYSLADYDNISLKAHKMVRYDCLAEAFPRLARSELPTAIFGVKYALNTAALEDYVLEEAEL